MSDDSMYTGGATDSKTYNGYDRKRDLYQPREGYDRYETESSGAGDRYDTDRDDSDNRYKRKDGPGFQAGQGNKIFV